MGGKKKGLSLEEKRQKLLEIYYDKVTNIRMTHYNLERGAKSEGD